MCPSLTGRATKPLAPPLGHARGKFYAKNRLDDLFYELSARFSWQSACCRPSRVSHSILRSETAIFVTEAIDRMGDADSPFEARLLYCSTPFMSPRSSSILTEDGAELPSRSKKKKSEAVFLPPQSGGVPQLFSTSLSHCSPLVRCSSRPQLAHPSACRRAGQREGRCPSRAGQN